LRFGFTTVTFRKKSPEEIIALAKTAGAEGVEWGGDVHVPPGDTALARSIREACDRNGLEIFSYGSYLRGLPGEDYEAVLETAQLLGAPMIRLWAGNMAPDKAGGHLDEIAGNLKKIAAAADEYGIRLGLEYHRGTLTQTKESALALLDAAGAENLLCYWQPNPQLDFEEHLREIRAIGPRLANLHVFNWRHSWGRDLRLPLGAAKKQWGEYIRTAAENARPYLILEFVKGDSVKNFYADMQILKELAGKGADNEAG